MATEVPAPVQAKASVVPPLPVFFRLDPAGVITEYKYGEMQKACDWRTPAEAVGTTRPRLQDRQGSSTRPRAC